MLARDICAQWKSTSDHKKTIIQEKKVVAYKHYAYNDNDEYDKSDDSMKYAYNNYRYESNTIKSVI